MGDVFSDDQLVGFLEDVQNIRDDVRKIGGDADFNKAFAEKMNQVRMGIRQRQMNLVRSRKDIRAALEFLNQDAFKGDVAEAVIALTVGGTQRLSKMGNLSIADRTLVLQAKYFTNYKSILEEIDAYDIMRKSTMDDDVAEAMFQLKPGGDLSKIKNDLAVDIAKRISSVQDQMLKELKRSGIEINRTAGYIFRQSHDPRKIMGDVKDSVKSRKLWKSFILSHLDRDRTFGKNATRKEVDTFLDKAYADITTGAADLNTGKGISDEFVTVWDRRLIGQALNKSRKLHFKSGRDFMDYHRSFGRDGGLHDSITKSLEFNARTAALRGRLGADPEANLPGIIKRWRNQFRAEGKDKEADKLNAMLRGENLSVSVEFAAMGGLEGIFRQLSGQSQMAGRSGLAKLSRNLRQGANIRLLPNAGIRSIADLGLIMTSLRSSTGKGYFESGADMVKNFMKTVKPSDQKIVAQKANLIIADDLNAAVQRWQSGEVSGQGFMAKLEQLSFRISGLHWLTNASRTSSIRMFMTELSDRSTMSLKEMRTQDPKFAAALNRIGITEAEWEVVRLGSEDVLGVQGITPEAIKSLDDAVVEKVIKPFGLKKSAEDIKAETEIKITAFLHDQAMLGSPGQSPRTRAVLIGGTLEDTLGGQARRFVAQFKSFAVTMHQVVGRSVLSNPEKSARTLGEAFNPMNGKTADFSNLIGMITTTSLLAYMADTIIDVANNRTPKDPFDPKTAINALVRSGAGGLYIDFLAGEYQKNYRSPIADLAGPVAGDINTLGEFWAKALRFDVKPKDVKKTLGQFVPFRNFPVGQAAFDYMIGHSINESLNPGSMRRMKKRLRNEGRDFIFEPEL